MGDMAEMYDECYAEIEAAEHFFEGVAYLIENTKQARRPIVVSIRKQYADKGFISEKQQWVLAFWLANHYETC
jgi:hypothetical protein